MESESVVSILETLFEASLEAPHTYASLVASPLFYLSTKVDE
jgi:hypothetical protein